MWKNPQLSALRNYDDPDLDEKKTITNRFADIYLTRICLGCPS